MISKKHSSKLKPVALLVAFLMVFAFVPASPVSAAEIVVADNDGTPTGIVGQINAYKAEQGNLTVTANGSVVTVTGNVDGRNTTLDLKINKGVKVVWRATTQTPEVKGPVINLTGGTTGDGALGEFEVATGSSIQNYNDGDYPAIAMQNVNLLISSGYVTSYNGSAVYDVGSNNDHTITVTGGTVNSGAGPNGPIYSYNANTSINITGGKVESTSYSAITFNNTSEHITVSGDAIVESASSDVSAIVIESTSSEVDVNGGFVRASGINRNAIYSTPSATYVKVNVNGGTVENTGKGNAILLTGDYSTVTVSGGTVRNAGGGNAIYLTGGSHPVVTVTGSGIVTSSGDGTAIRLEGNEARANINGGEVGADDASGTALWIIGNNAVYKTEVKINGGNVHANGTSGTAIRLDGNGGEIRINGGTVSATGTNGTAVKTTGTNVSFTIESSNAVVEGEFTGEQPTYSKPSAPVNVTAAAGDALATISWSAPVGDGGKPITEYIVTASPGSLTVTTSALSTTISGLTNDTAYTFTVKAINSIGESALSAVSNTVTPKAVNTDPKKEDPKKEDPKKEDPNEQSKTDPPADIAKATIAAVPAKTYNGSQQKPKITVKFGGLTLTSGTDYTVAYGTNKIGKGTITISGKGAYTGVKTVNFTINHKKMTIKSAVSKKKSRSITVKWAKTSNVTRYEVQYKLNTAKKWKTVKVSSKSSGKVIKKLKENKKYQVRLRVCYTKAGTDYHGAWSKSKTVKTR
jgi:hypothetical protein